MNDKEFRELQKEFGESIVSYENFCKKMYLLDIEYNYHFHEYIEKEYKLLEENALLKDVIIQLNEKKALAEIEQYVSDVTTKYNKNIVALRNKQMASELIFKNNSTLSKELIQDLEVEFKNYALSNHPAVKILISTQERAVYDQLRKFYFDNNYNSFTALLDLNQNVIRPSLLTEDKYNMAAEYYYTTMGKLRIEVNSKTNQYPLNKENVFHDEFSIAAEEAEFKIRLNHLLGMNKSLHKDIIEIYGEDIVL